MQQYEYDFDPIEWTLPEGIPEDVAAEECLLATLAEPGNEKMALMELAKLSVEDFIHPSHRAVFLALKENIGAGVENHLMLIKNKLAEQGKLSLVGGLPWLMALLAKEKIQRPSVVVAVLHEKRRRRQLMRLGQALIDKSSSGEPPEETITQAQGDLKTISETGRSLQSVSAMEILHKMASMECLRSGTKDRAGWWGIPALDDLIPIPAGEFTVVGARPGVGKTTFLCQIACASAERGLNVLILTMEIPKEDLEARLGAHLAYTGMKGLKDGTYGPDQVNAVGRHGSALERLRYMDPSAGTTWASLEAMIRYEVDRHRIDLVLLDQLDKIGRPPVAKGSNEAYSFGAVVQGIMATTKEMKIGLVLLCQLKADAQGKEPDLSSHADSDRPGKDGGLVVHLWRTADHTKAIVQKHRNGPGEGRVFTLDFDGAHQRITESDRATDPVPPQNIVKSVRKRPNPQEKP